MTSRSKRLIILFVLFLLISPLHAYQHPAQDDNHLIMMSVVVWNRSGLTKGLKREVFTVMDEKVVRPIEFFDDTDTPVSIGILVDNSGSMHPNIRGVTSKQDFLGEELKQLLANGHPDNEYFLVSFNKTPKLLADWSSAKEMMALRFEIEEPKHDTALYDTIFLALEKLHSGQRLRRALVLLSDGQDNASRRTFKEVRTSLRNADVTVYAVGIMGASDVGSSLGIEGQGILDELSETTGGGSSYPTSRKELTTAFSTIAGELHHHYRLGFRPDKSDAPNKWRRLKITVTIPPNAAPEFKNLSVRARSGYYTR
ncbi:MAG TPA: VWA domain-containing protein [Pyrinomonadaceae bacterium]